MQNLQQKCGFVVLDSMRSAHRQRTLRGREGACRGCIHSMHAPVLATRGMLCERGIFPRDCIAPTAARFGLARFGLHFCG